MSRLKLWDCVIERDIPWSVGVVTEPEKNGWVIVETWDDIRIYASPYNFIRLFNWVDGNQ